MKFYSKPYVKAFYAGNYFARLTAGAVLSIGLLSFPSCSDDDPVEEVGNGISSSQTVLVEEGNMPMAGTITAQYADFVGGNDLSKLVDGNERTMYTTSHNAFSICYEAESPVIVNYYALTSSTNIETMDPYTWTLSGSNDAQTWDVLDRQAGQRFRTRLYTMEYEFNNATAYRYYQLEIEDNNGGDQTSIGEWILSEGALDPTKPYSIEVGTENMLNPLGRISSEFNDSPVGEKIDKLVDGNASTNFVTSHNKFYIQWNQLDNIKTYGTYYTLTAALGDASTAPRAWKIYSSENGSQWELQDEQTNQTFEGGETKRFSFKENTDYSKTAPSHLYYKLEIEDNNGASTTQIAEWTVGYECRNLGDVMYFAENFTRSDRTPMGVMYQDLPETTDEFLELIQTIYQKSVVEETDSSKKIYPFIWTGTQTVYWNMVEFTMFAQYEGYEGYKNFWQGKDSLGRLSPEGFASLGKLELMNVLEGIVMPRDEDGNYVADPMDGYCYPNSIELSHYDAQTYFMDGKAAFTVCGNWLEREMEESYPRGSKNIAVMKTPVLSAAEEKWKDDPEMLEEIRSIQYSTGPMISGLIPTYSKEKEIAKDFLLYLFKDENIELTMKYSLALSPYQYTPSQEFLENTTTFHRSQIEIDKTAKYIFDEKLSSKLFYRNDNLNFYPNNVFPVDAMTTPNLSNRQRPSEIWESQLQYVRGQWSSFIAKL